MPPRERERERSRRRRGPRGGDPNRPSQQSRRERGLPTEDRGRGADRDQHRDRGVEYRRVARGRGRARDASRDSRDWPRHREVYRARSPRQPRFRRPTLRKRGRPGVHRRGHRARQRRRASTLSVVETRDRDHELAESGGSCGFGFLKAEPRARGGVG